MTGRALNIKKTGVLMSMVAAAALSACGGAQNNEVDQGASIPAPTPAPTPSPSPSPSPSPAPAPAPAPAPTPAPAPAPAPAPGTAVTYYFSDCQTGAAAGCVPGSNANAGTSASAPKQNLSGVDLNSLAAGSQLLFARGGAWSNVNISVRNLNATATSPIVFDSYAASWSGSAKPLLKTAVANAVSFGNYSDTTVDGGYTFRNLKFDGQGVATWGFFLMGGTRNVLIEGNEITGFQIGLHFQNQNVGNQAMVVRNNDIYRNSEMGMLGDANDMVIEGNTIRENNFSGSGFNHGLYLGGHATNGIVRNNRFINNSMLNGTCTGGNLTVHGQWDGLLIEGNLVQVDSATNGCWGISVNDGYTSAEFFRNVTVRSNEVVNVECAICVRAAPAIVIESNKLRSNQSQLPSGIIITPPNGGDDDPGIGATVRNNTICFTDPTSTGPNASPIRISVSGGVISGTVYQTGSSATTGACAP